MSAGLGQRQRAIAAELARHPGGMTARQLVWNLQSDAATDWAPAYYRRALRSMQERGVVAPEPGRTAQKWLLTDAGYAQIGRAGRCRRPHCVICMGAD